MRDNFCSQLVPNNNLIASIVWLDSPAPNRAARNAKLSVRALHKQCTDAADRYTGTGTDAVTCVDVS